MSTRLKRWARTIEQIDLSKRTPEVAIGYLDSKYRDIAWRYIRILETGVNFWMAALETAIGTVGFVCLLMFLKPIKARAKAAKKERAAAEIQE